MLLRSIADDGSSWRQEHLNARNREGGIRNLAPKCELDRPWSRQSREDIWTLRDVRLPPRIEGNKEKPHDKAQEDGGKNTWHRGR